MRKTDPSLVFFQIASAILALACAIEIVRERGKELVPAYKNPPTPIETSCNFKEEKNVPCWKVVETNGE